MTTLIFVDGSSNVEQLMSKITNNSKIIVISFDIRAHNKLSELGIEHKKIEHYIDYNDRKLIDDFTLYLVKNWYNNEVISKFLQYDGINLGWLLEVEILAYFLQIIKFFVGVMKAIEIEKPSIIIAKNHLALMVKNIDKKNMIATYSIPDDKTPTLQFNIIEIPINVGTKIFRIKISRNLALTVKKIVESITYSVFNLKLDLIKSMNIGSILLLEFEPSTYGEFLKMLSKLGKNIVLLNERRPSVWNLRSLKSVTRSKSKTLRLKDFLNDKLTSLITKKQKDLETRMDEMFSHTENLEKVFSIKNHSFWLSIKDDFSLMCKRRFTEAIEKIELTKELFSKMDVSNILTMYNTGLEEKIILSISNKMGISGIMLQHGFYPQNKYMERFLPLLNPYPTLGLKATVWSNKLKEYWITLGLKSDDILLVGNPRYDPIFDIRDKLKSDNTILLASNHIMAADFAGIDTDIYIKFENMFNDVVRISNNIPNKKLIVKLHGGHAYYDVVPLIRKIDPSIPIYQTQDIMDYIKKCDVLISVTWSTVILDAIFLNKPTITFLSDPKGFENEDVIKKGATLLVTSPQEFEIALNNILHDEKFRNSLLERGRKYLNEYLINQGKSSEILVGFMKDTVNE